MRSMRRHRRSLEPSAEINLTPMLDLTFVLLLSFMIVAPSLKYGVELELPAVSEGAPQLASDEQNLATIVIPRALSSGSGAVRTFLLDGAPADLNEIEKALTARREKLGDKLAVEIQSDRDVPYEAFVQVVAAIRRAGVSSVGLPVDSAGNPTWRDGGAATRP